MIIPLRLQARVALTWVVAFYSSQPTRGLENENKLSAYLTQSGAGCHARTAS